MNNRDEMLDDIVECLGYDSLQALQHHRVREVEGWELAAGLWSRASQPVEDLALQGLRQFNEIIYRSDIMAGQVVIDACVMGDDGSDQPRVMRGVGLWLRNLAEMPDAS